MKTGLTDTGKKVVGISADKKTKWTGIVKPACLIAIQPSNYVVNSVEPSASLDRRSRAALEKLLFYDSSSLF